MELIQGFIQPPKVQSADETIPTLCDRVENATLISDRRSAVLGLKAFAREYRESVIASGLKPLINTLKRDYVDENSVKSILETVLILFIRGDGDADLTRNWISRQSRLQNGKYPSPLVMKQEKQHADQFSLWIADAITQSDELVHLLIGLLDTGNFHIKLYTIQLLEALVSARPTRSRNAIISLPTGVSTLITLLGDIHEPIRDEAVLLIMAVVNESTHVQVLVAFENIFEKLFSIIEEEGGLRGSIVVNDCLLLIHNILRYNTSNQTLFLETGNLPRLAQILNEPLLGEFFWTEQRVVNINTALDIISLTVDPSSSTTPRNQSILLESNVLMIVLRLAFHHNIPKDVRPMALLSASDMVRGNEFAQREFAKIDVPYFDPTLPYVKSKDQLISIVTLLLNWTFYTNSVHIFSLRVAAIELLKSYLYENKEIQLEFLKLQIEDYIGNETSFLKSNLFEAILDYDLELKLNPYKLFFAVDLLMYLFESDDEDSNELREMTRKVTIGGDFDEEEKLGSIQTLSELTITSLASEDVRIPISYITFLIFWLYGDQNAVNDFLTNRDTIQSLLSFSYQVEGDDITIKCLVTMLLGVSYEFSSRHSPFPRKDYFEYITKTLGRDNYSSRISQFKSDSIFFGAPKEITLIPRFDETGLPQVYFSPYFVTFFNENYYRIKTALLHSCIEEPYAKISYETFEELQGQCHALKEEMKRLESNGNVSILDLEKKLTLLNEEYQKLSREHGVLEEDYSKTSERLLEIEQELKEIKDSLGLVTNERNKLSTEIFNKQEALEKANNSSATNMEKVGNLEIKLKNVTADKQKAEEGINKMTRELMSLTRIKGELESKIKVLEKRIDKLTNDFNKKEKSFETKLEKKDKDLGSLQTTLKQAEGNISSLCSEKDALIKDSGEWKSKFRSHDSLISRMSEKLKSLSENYKILQDERDSLLKHSREEETEFSNELAALKNKLDILSSEKSKLNSQKEELIERLSSLKSRYDFSCQDYEKEIVRLNDGIEELRKTISHLELLMENLKQSQNETVENSNDLRKRCTEFEEELRNQESSKKEADKRFMELKQNFEVSTKDLEKLAKEKQELNLIKEANEKELSRLRDELENKEQELSSQSKYIEKLDGMLNQQRTSNKDSERELKDGIEVLETGKKEVLSKNEELKKSIELLKKNYESSEEKNLKTVEDLKERILEIEKELVAERNNVKQIEDRLQERSESLEHLKQSAANDKNEMKKLESKHSSLMHENDDLILKEESLTAKLAKIERDFEENQRNLESLKIAEKEKAHELEELRENSKKELDLKQDVIADLRVTQDELLRKIEDLKLCMKNASEEKNEAVEGLQKEKLELSKLQQDSRGNLDGRDRKIAELETKIKSLSSELSRVTKKSEDDLQKHQAMVQRLEQEKSEIVNRIVEIEKHSKTKIEEKENRIRDLENSELKVAAEFSKLQKNSQNDRVEVTHLKKELEHKVLRFEQERKLFNEGSDDLTKQYSERITVLEDQLHEINIDVQEKNKQLQNAKSAADEFIGELKNQLEGKIHEISNLKLTISERENVTSKLKSDLRISMDTSDKKIGNLEEEVQSLKKYLSDKEVLIMENKDDLRKRLNEKEELESETASLKQELEDSSRVANELNSDISKLKETQKKITEEKDDKIRNLEMTVGDLKLKDERISKKLQTLELELRNKDEKCRKSETEKSNEVERLKTVLKEKENAVGKLEAKNLKSSENQEVEFKQNGMKLNTGIATGAKDNILESDLISRHDGTGSLLIAEKDSLESKLKEAQESLRSLNKSSEERERHFEEIEKHLKQESEHLKSELDKLRLETSGSKREHKEELDATDGINSEIDDLMLLVTDLDEKNSKYRARLQELGIELGSDEEDEEEE